MNLKDPKTKFLLEVIKSRKYDKYTRKIATEVIASKNNMEVKDVEDYIKFGSVQPTGITRKINLKEDDFRSEAVRLAGRAIKGLDRPHFRTKKKITGMKVMALILLLILVLTLFGIIFGVVILDKDTATKTEMTPITEPSDTEESL